MVVHKAAHLDGDIVVLLDKAVLILGPKDDEIVHFDDAGVAGLKDRLQAIDGSGTAGFAQETSSHFHVLAHHAPEELIPPIACISQTLGKHHGCHLDLLSNCWGEELVRGAQHGHVLLLPQSCLSKGQSQSSSRGPYLQSLPAG